MTSTIQEPRTEADYEAAVKQMLVEADRLNQQMASDRKEIDRLKFETRYILATLGVAV